MKRYPDKGKFAAPRWLAYPQLDSMTIGWRMGYGEEYILNEPPRPKEFGQLFPMPKNWLSDIRQSKSGRMVFLGFAWDGDWKAKYSQIGDDIVVVNDFITIDQEGDFKYNHFTFSSIEHAVLFSKHKAFGKSRTEVKLEEVEILGVKKVFKEYVTCNPTFEELKEGIGLTPEELEEWEMFKYTVCLNAAYYKVMQDDGLKEKLLATGDSTLVYVSDDEWGGDENLFGFALMELRDEIRRLYENEDLIDWEYTDYIRCNPYGGPAVRDPNDRQSPEYRVVETTLENALRHVRDVNLSPEIAARYETGQILTEIAFVDASDRIGGMVTTHRYLILSQFMADLSEFEDGTNWGLHVANAGSRFKVLDIFTVGDRTQILLLQLPEGFEEVFEEHRDVEDEFVERERENFKQDLKRDPIDELTGGKWLERCSFPIGMNDNGEFF